MSNHIKSDSCRCPDCQQSSEGVVVELVSEFGGEVTLNVGVIELVKAGILPEAPWPQPGQRFKVRIGPIEGE